MPNYDHLKKYQFKKGLGPSSNMNVRKPRTIEPDEKDPYNMTMPKESEGESFEETLRRKRNRSSSIFRRA